jgi:hypothetical protein
MILHQNNKFYVYLSICDLLSQVARMEPFHAAARNEHCVVQEHSKTGGLPAQQVETKQTDRRHPEEDTPRTIRERIGKDEDIR